MAEAGASVNPSGPVLPARVCVSDKLRLVEEPAMEPDEWRRGRKTWLAAVVALPLVGLCLLLGVYLLATSTPTTPHHGKLLARPTRKIFIVDVNHSDVQSKQKIENLESCLQLHRFAEVYLVLVNRYTNQPVDLAHYEALKLKYHNFHYLIHNPTAFFSDSIFGDTLKEGHTLRQLLFKAQLLTLWRYGGIVLSPFWCPLKALNKTVFEQGKGNLVVGMYNDRVGVLAARDSCHARVFDLMRQMCNASQLGKSFESDLIDRTIVTSKKGIAMLGFPQLCNNVTKSDQCWLMKNNEQVTVIRPIVLPARTNATLVEALRQRAPQQKRAPVYFHRFFIFPQN